jgi:hypothetical protein
VEEREEEGKKETKKEGSKSKEFPSLEVKVKNSHQWK